MERVGILHPGEMGISVIAAARDAGHLVFWASAGRSARTRERASRHGIPDLGTVETLSARCTVIVSVCPPSAAEGVAREVVESGFTGLYVEANAISPERARRIGAAMAAAGARFVDGGIIGGPAWTAGTTWLYLSGKDAADAAACFTAGPLGTVVIGEAVGRASALKLCFAAYSKGSTALLGAILAAAEAEGVRDDLRRQWSRDGSPFAEQIEERLRRATAKAWRFEGEMEEIAAMFESRGLPAGFHTAAADLYRRLAPFRSAPTSPPIDAVLAALLPEDEAPEGE